MIRYFAIVTLDRLAELKRVDGYPEAMRRLDELRWALLARCQLAEHARVSRLGVEFLFTADDSGAAEAFLVATAHAMADPLLTGADGSSGRIVAAAVPCLDGLCDNTVADGNAALARALRERRPVLVVGEREGAAADQLLKDLQQALDGGELAINYQPKIHCRTCEIAGAEALLRWTHPLRGPISPELFIPLAEQSGAIRALTRWVIRQTVSEQRRMRADGLDISINVNISAPLISDPTFVDEALADVEDSCGVIGFEITETAMMSDPEGTLANLHRLSSAGIHLAIDDYGSGYSSLAYLQRLPIQELKIDKMFISRLSQGSRDPLLVRSTIDLAHALEMEVTAEGVESAAAFALLQVMRCDLVQGYFLSPALTIDELLGFARRGAPMADIVRPASMRERLAQRRSGRETAA